jgi:ubiquinone biosynthesis protein UbiJ
VRCDAIRKLIGQELAGKPSVERDELLGRAIGRVMAHELYHVLLRTTSHGGQGLAAPSQSVAELLSERDVFAPGDERKLSQSAGWDFVESFGLPDR